MEEDTIIILSSGDSIPVRAEKIIRSLLDGRVESELVQKTAEVLEKYSSIDKESYSLNRTNRINKSKKWKRLK